MTKYITPSRLVWCAVILILVSVIIDLTIALNTARATPQQIVEELSGWGIFSAKVAGNLTRELGFAAAIAWMISMAIERVAREREEANFRAIRQAIAQDVFKAVIGSFVPKEIRDLAFETILLAPVTRSVMRIEYVFKPLPGTAERGGRHVLLETRAEYSVKNESSAEIDYNVDMFITKCPAPALSTNHRLISIAINETILSAEEIAAGDRALPDTDSEQRYRWPRKIPPLGTLGVVAHWSLVKETSDTEIWTGLIPSSHFELTIDMQIPGLDWGVEPLHHGVLKQMGTKAKLGLNHYIASRPLLPYQGIAIWWRPEVPGPTAAPMAESQNVVNV